MRRRVLRFKNPKARFPVFLGRRQGRSAALSGGAVAGHKYRNAGGRSCPGTLDQAGYGSGVWGYQPTVRLRGSDPLQHRLTTRLAPYTVGVTRSSTCSIARGPCLSGGGPCFLPEIGSSTDLTTPMRRLGFTQEEGETMSRSERVLLSACVLILGGIAAVLVGALLTRLYQQGGVFQ